MEVLVWAGITVLFIIVEICTVQLVSIWLAAGAIITMICTYFFEISWIGQLGIFLVTSTIFLVMSLPMLKKRMEKQHIATNSELDVGKSAVVIEEINSDHGTGRVTLNGVNWSAVSENGDVIAKDAVVIVTGIMSAKLKVKLKTND